MEGELAIVFKPIIFTFSVEFTYSFESVTDFVHEVAYVFLIESLHFSLKFGLGFHCGTFQLGKDYLSVYIFYYIRLTFMCQVLVFVTLATGVGLWLHGRQSNCPSWLPPTPFILPHQVWFVKLECCGVCHFLAVSNAVGFWGWGLSLLLPVMFPRKSFFRFRYSLLYTLHYGVSSSFFVVCATFWNFFVLDTLSSFRISPALFFADDPIIHSTFDFGNFHCCVLHHSLAVRSGCYIYGKNRLTSTKP